MILTVFGVATAVVLALGALDTSTQLAVDAYIAVVRVAGVLVISLLIVAVQTADHRAMISRVESTVGRVENAVYEVGRQMRADAVEAVHEVGRQMRADNEVAVHEIGWQMRTDAEVAVSRALSTGLHAMTQAGADLEAARARIAADQRTIVSGISALRREGRDWDNLWATASRQMRHLAAVPDEMRALRERMDDFETGVLSRLDAFEVILERRMASATYAEGYVDGRRAGGSGDDWPPLRPVA